MNTRVAIGTVAGLVLVALAYGMATFPKHAEVISGTQATSTETATSTIIGAPSNLKSGEPSAAQTQNPAQTKSQPLSVKIGDVAVFDTIDMVVSTPSPVITGLANTKTVDVVIADSENRGLAAGRAVPVSGGKWSYSPPLLLQPGKYLVQLFAGTYSVQTSLTVK